jgi:hypothetical protein
MKMWGSLLVSDVFDIPFEVESHESVIKMCSHLYQHPLLKGAPPQQGQSIMGAPEANENPDTTSESGGQLTPSEGKKDLPDGQMQQQQQIQSMAEKLTGANEPEQPPASGGLAKSVHWFDTFGKSAHDMVKELKHARREHKMVKGEIDELINIVRLMKQDEINGTLSSISWSDGYISTIKSIGLTDRDLKALTKHAEAKKGVLVHACNLYKQAENDINTLLEKEDEWTTEDKELWVKSHDLKDDAKKMWRTNLHSLDALNKSEMAWLNLAVDQLSQHGEMSSRTIMNNLIESGQALKGLTPNKLSGLMRIYGDELNIVKGAKRNSWVLKDDGGGLIIKDPWAYAAGFIDADGYITITKRGEPRVGIIATGERGKVHCEELQKTLGCGVLQLDLKLYQKSSKRSQHRLQFYSKADVRKVLKGVEPHLRLKKNQANNVLEYIDTPRKGTIAKQRRDQLEKLVKYDNWSDKKGDELLSEWGVKEEDIMTWRDPTLMQLGIEAERLEAML